MKKTVLLLCLAAVIILSGCFPFSSFLQRANPVPNSIIAESLVSRMKSNIDTHTLEGFTGESTFEDVLEKIEPSCVRIARLVYNSELLGYPAAVSYIFGYYGGEHQGQLVLDHIYYDIYPADGNSINSSMEEELLAKLDAKLSSHKKESDEDGTDYIWEKGGCNVRMSVHEIDNEQDTDVHISVYAPVVVMGKLPKIPDIFPYQFGTDISTIYKNVTPGMLPEGFSESDIDYLDDGIEICLRFKTDEAGQITLNEGDYFINLNYMGLEESINYFETIADGLEAAIGEPDDRDARETFDSGERCYRIDIDWPGIYFSADCGSWPTIYLDFYEEYLAER